MQNNFLKNTLKTVFYEQNRRPSMNVAESICSKPGIPYARIGKPISKHLSLQEDLVCSILEHTTAHGAIEGKTQTSKTKY